MLCGGPLTLSLGPERPGFPAELSCLATGREGAHPDGLVVEANRGFRGFSERGGSGLTPPVHAECTLSRASRGSTCRTGEVAASQQLTAYGAPRPCQ